MTESPDPASAWWALLTPEVRKFWFQRITGWSVEGAMKAAFAEATGERKEPVPANERYAQSVIENVARGMPQKVVVITYAAAILAAAKGWEAADWPAVNQTIIDRWNIGALDRIKRAAWKIVKSEQPPATALEARRQFEMQSCDFGRDMPMAADASREASDD
jgi:hypothetical protein